MSTDGPAIPAHLLTFDTADWEHLQQGGNHEVSSPGFRQQNLQEHWLVARDQWCREHGIDTPRFEMLAAWQRATTHASTSDDEPA